MGRRVSGFTLIELMVTVTILVVLVGLAAPSFQSTIANTRIATQAGRFMTALSLMRAEAVKRNQTVRLCKSKRGASCDGESWRDGWLMWIDLEGDKNHQAGDTAEVIRFYESLPEGVSLKNSRKATWIGYRGDGAIISSKGLGNATWTFCPANGDADVARKIVINRVGRARQERGADCGSD